MSELSDFYDVKISQDTICEKDRNNITNMLMKNEETSNNQNDKPFFNNNNNNQCFFLFLVVFTSVTISICLYFFLITK
jgi:hypothetical protein